MNLIINCQQINARELHETLMPILEKFHDRVRYLDCSLNENITSTFSEMQVKQPEVKADEVKLTSKRFVATIGKSVNSFNRLTTTIL